MLLAFLPACAATKDSAAPALESAASSPGEAPAPAQPSQGAGVHSSDDTAELRGAVDALAELDRSERELDRVLGGAASPSATPLSSDECGVACRALASMQRAAQHLCEAVTEEGAPRCESARGRVGRAEARVRERCPACSVSR